MFLQALLRGCLVAILFLMGSHNSWAQMPALEQVFKGHSAVMLLIDPASGELVDANPAAEAFYGYERDSLVGMHIQQINTLSPEQVAEERALAQQQGRNYFIFRHRLADDEIRTVEVYSSPFEFEGRQLLLSVIHDITPGRNLEQGLWHYQERLEELVDARTSVLEQRTQWLIAALVLMILITLALVFTYLQRKAVTAALIQSTREKEESKRLAALVFSHANEGICITDPDANLVEVNRAFSTITGYRRDEVLGHNPRILSSGRQPQAFYAEMWQNLKSKGHWYGEVWNRHKNGRIYAVLLNISGVGDDKGQVRNYIGLFSDITLIKEQQKQLERLAHYDALTHLPNRLLLSDRLQQAMQVTQRHQNHLAVVYLDLDHFKQVNDVQGHAIGDQVLVEVSRAMQETLRAGDTLARIGGDEFVVVLANLPDKKSCEPSLKRLIQAASKPVRVGEVTLEVTVSLGVSFWPQPERVEADQLMRQADQAMYQAKQAGRNNYQFFDVAKDQEVRSQHQDTLRIEQALAKREFVLYYQPKVNMYTGVVLGVEALIRWQHPKKGLLPPAAFLPAIEYHPLSVQVGDWVIQMALEQLNRWREQGLHLPIAVNVNPLQLQEPNFARRLAQLLAEYPQLQPSDLQLEILETSALEDFTHVSKVLYECQTLGVGIAVDDFGTGYSSLAYLKQLPSDLIKIDQGFVRNMLDNQDDLAILEGVLGLATAFHREVIAEGVETPAHGQLLLQLGCDWGQGYAIARPMPAEALPAWLESWQPPESWLNTQTLSSDGLAALHALVEHRAWVKQLIAYLDETLDQPPGLNSDVCVFGRWLNQDQNQANTQLLDQADKIHQDIHTLAQKLVKLKQAGQNQAAQAGLEELLHLRDALIQAVQQLLQSQIDTIKS